MKCKKLVVWWLVTEQEHPLLINNEKKNDLLVQAVLPGVNYYSITGFSQVMKHHVTCPEEAFS